MQPPDLTQPSILPYYLACLPFNGLRHYRVLAVTIAATSSSSAKHSKTFESCFDRLFSLLLKVCNCRFPICDDCTIFVVFWSPTLVSVLPRNRYQRHLGDWNGQSLTRLSQLSKSKPTCSKGGTIRNIDLILHIDLNRYPARAERFRRITNIPSPTSPKSPFFFRSRNQLQVVKMSTIQQLKNFIRHGMFFFSKLMHFPRFPIPRFAQV